MIEDYFKDIYERKENRYKRERTNPFYLLFTYSIMMILFIRFPFFLINRALEMQKDYIATFLSVLLLWYGAYVLTLLLYYYFRTSYKFLLKEKAFEHENIFSKWKGVEYSKIFSIADYNKTGRTAVVKYRDAQNTIIKVYIHVVTSNFLELIETIIERSENLEELNIPKALEFAEFIKSDGGKSPNWDIINRAKQRAKENREKKQKENP